MQNFGREIFDDSTCIRQIRQTFPPSKFYAIRYYIEGFAAIYYIYCITMYRIEYILTSIVCIAVVAT